MFQPKFRVHIYFYWSSSSTIMENYSNKTSTPNFVYKCKSLILFNYFFDCFLSLQSSFLTNFFTILPRCHKLCVSVFFLHFLTHIESLDSMFLFVYWNNVVSLFDCCSFRWKISVRNKQTFNTEFRCLYI